MTENNIRRPTVSIPLTMEEGVRPSKPAVTRVTWDAADSEARSVQKIQAREEAIAEFQQQAKQKDPEYQELQRLRQVVQDQQHQLDLLMKMVKGNRGPAEHDHA